MLLVWYAGVHGPFSRDIGQSLQARAHEEKHLALARDIEALRAQVKRFQGRLPENTDPNEWVEYVLGGIRRYPIKLASLKPDTPRKHGPFNVVVLKIVLEGPYPDLDKLIGWLESNDRLFRIDSVQLEPHRSSNGDMNMVLVVLGVMG